MATKRPKSTLQRIVETLGDLVRQPMSDESNETPTPKAVRRSKRIAAGPRRKAATKTKKAATKKRAAKAKPAARKKKKR